MDENKEQVVEKNVEEVNTNKDAVKPDGSFKKWNWGAFSFTLYWGIANKVWISFLVFVPFVNIVWPFILAYNGNKWAYDAFKSNRLSGDDKFNYAQKTWNTAGFWAFIVMLIVGIFYIILIAVLGVSLFGGSNSYENPYDYYY